MLQISTWGVTLLFSLARASFLPKNVIFALFYANLCNSETLTIIYLDVVVLHPSKFVSLKRNFAKKCWHHQNFPIVLHFQIHFINMQLLWKFELDCMKTQGDIAIFRSMTSSNWINYSKDKKLTLWFFPKIFDAFKINSKYIEK